MHLLEFHLVSLASYFKLVSCRSGLAFSCLRPRPLINSIMLASPSC